MNKLFGLLLLALACWAPSAAYAVNCFWVGGTGTWDASSITNWGPTSGGAATGCQTTNAAPAAGDTITFDANSGGGTATPTTAINGIAFGALSAGGYTNGTLAFNTNNPSPTFTTASLSGNVTRTINMGSGTWTLSATTGNVFDNGTQTNCTSCVYSNATIVFSAASPTGIRNFLGGSVTYGTLTINSAAARLPISMTGANTFGSWSLAAGTAMILPSGATQTISNAITLTGTSSLPIFLSPSNTSFAATLSFSSGTSTLTWGAINFITTTGAGTFTATNCLDLGRNTFDTGDSCSPPSGGGGGGRIIGG